MKIKSWFWLLTLLVIPLIFFYQIFLGKIPFPGDLLVGNYEPYKSLSYAGYQPGGVPHKAQGPDVIKELVPWKKFTVDSYKSGQIPFWNPYNFAGNPLMANFQSGVFFPTNIIFLLTDFSVAWSIYILLIPILASSFTYLFIRRLKLSQGASIFGGLIFAFSSYMAVWMEYGNIGYTFVFLPLILFFSDRLIEKINTRNFLGIVAGSTLAVLAGYIQGVFYIYAIVGVYYLVKSKTLGKLKIPQFLIFASALLIPIILTAFQLLPTLELFGQSSRGNYTLFQIQNMLNPIYYLITTVVPDFFGNPAGRNYWIDGTYIERVSYFGLIPFAFCLFAIVSQIKRIEVKIFAFLFIISLILATDLFFTKFFYLIPIPVISTTVATRILSIATFAGCILASFGYDELIEKKNFKKFIYCCGIIFIFLFVLFGFTSFYFKISLEIPVESLAIARRNLIIPITTFVVFAFSSLAFYKLGKIKLFKRFGKVAIISVIFLITFSDLFYYFHKITPFAPKAYLYPSTPVVEYLKKQQGIDRSWGYGAGYMASNFQTFESLYSTEGNDPLHVKDYTELVASSANGRVPEVLPRPDANIAPGYGRQELTNNPYRQKALNITGVKYLLNKDEALIGEYNPDYTSFPEDRYKLIWQKGFWQVYENKISVPRFFLTNNYLVEGNKKKILRSLYNENFDERKTVIVEKDPQIKKGNLVQPAKLISYKPNKVEIETNATSSALLFLSDTNFPAWQAKIDGTPVSIYQADYAFRAVPVKSGKHTVVFEYIPSSFTKGLWIALIGVVATVIASLIIKKKYGY